MPHSREWFLRRRRRRQRRNQRYGDKAVFDGINWDWYTHEQLHEFAKSADIGAMRQQAGGWVELGRAIGDTTDQVRGIVNGLLQTWQGASATQAAISNQSLTEWAQGASETALKIGAGLHKYTDAAEYAKANMPPPESQEHLRAFATGGLTQPNSAVAIMSLTQDHMLADQRQREGKAQAVHIMRGYGEESQDVHNTMPWFYDGPADQGPPPLDGGGDTTLHPEPPPRPLPDPDPDPLLDPSGTGSTASGTTASGFAPVGVGTGDGGAGGYGSATGPGLPGSGGGARGGGGGIGSGPFAARGPGAPGLAGARGVVGGTGAGVGGLPPVAPGAGTQREEDREHKTKYVEGEDWLDDDLPPFSSGVIGAW